MSLGDLIVKEFAGYFFQEHPEMEALAEAAGFKINPRKAARKKKVCEKKETPRPRVTKTEPVGEKKEVVIEMTLGKDGVYHAR